MRMHTAGAYGHNWGFDYRYRVRLMCTVVYDLCWSSHSPTWYGHATVARFCSIKAVVVQTGHALVVPYTVAAPAIQHDASSTC